MPPGYLQRWTPTRPLNSVHPHHRFPRQPSSEGFHRKMICKFPKDYPDSIDLWVDSRLSKVCHSALLLSRIRRTRSGPGKCSFVSKQACLPKITCLDLNVENTSLSVILYEDLDLMVASFRAVSFALFHSRPLQHSILLAWNRHNPSPNFSCDSLQAENS